MSCTSCGQDLAGKPKINVEGSVYCYQCSKKEVEARNEAKRQAVYAQYERERRAYDEAWAKFDKEQQAWRRERDNFVMAGTPGCGLGVFGGILSAIVCYGIAESYEKDMGIIGVILGVLLAFFLWRNYLTSLQRQRDVEFRSLQPAPKFDLPYPQRPRISPVVHAPLGPDGSTSRTVNYREEILRRDNFTCQVCGHKKRRVNLEVHHIIPRARGGTDDPTNLITVCKPCHDREDWYEHIRAYPTTVRKFKRHRR